MNAIDFNTMIPNAELNSLQKSVNTDTKGVEIFCAMCEGKDISKYGKDVDKVDTYLKGKAQDAVNGDLKAQAELNAITTKKIETPLLKRLSIFDFMGEKITVGFNEEVKYRVQNIEGEMSRWQAVNGAFPFATNKWSTRTMDTQNITGGVLTDHREFLSGNYDAIQEMSEQVVTDMTNKVFYKVVEALYNAVKTGKSDGHIVNFEESAGITKASVDSVLKRAKRFGNVTISGDYSVVSQMEDMAGFKVDTTGGVRFSEAVMEEIRKTGLLKMYKGSPIVEIPNAFNMTQLNAKGDFYETYLPEGLLFFLVTGLMSPLKIGFKGGLQAMSGQDISLRADVTRYDMEVGTVVIPEHLAYIGLVSDTNFAVTK